MKAINLLASLTGRSYTVKLKKKMNGADSLFENWGTFFTFSYFASQLGKVL
jgi:hypothetical protein